MSNRYKSSFTGSQIDTSVNKVINVGYNSDEITNNVSASGVTGAKVSNALATLKTTVDNAVSSGSANSAIAVFPINASGSVNAYIGNFSGQNLFTDMIILLTINVTNTGASTFNYGSTGNKKIQKFNGANTKIDVEPRELQQNRPYYLKYDGTDFILINAKDVATYSAEQTETVEIASLPNTAVDGEFDVSVSGNTIIQAITNGAFVNGTTNWSAGNSTLSVSGGVLKITGNGTGTQPRAFQSSVLKSGRRYFQRAICRIIKFGSLNADRIRLDGENVETAEIVNPTLNTLYKIIKVEDMTADRGATIRSRYGSNAGSDTSEMLVYEMFALDITNYPNLYNLTASQIDELYDYYVEKGIKHVEANRAKVVGKNLFDNDKVKISTGAYRDGSKFTRNFTSVFISAGSTAVNVKAGQTYKLIRTLTGGQLELRYFRSLEDANASGDVNIIGFPQTFTGTGSGNTTAPSGSNFVRITLGNSTTIGEISFSNIMFTNDTTATTYEPYTETTRYFDKSLKSLPNGTKDTIDNNGLYTKRLSDLQDITGTTYASIDTATYTDVDVVKTTAFSAMRATTTGVDGFTRVLNKDGVELSEVAQADIDLTASVGKYYVHTDKTIWFIVADGTYADVDGARTGLGTSKVMFELATPTTEQLPLQPLQSQASGTIYNEPVTRELLTYDTGLTLTNDLRKADKNFIESLFKVDGETKTPIALTSVTATNSKLITITGASNYDTYEIVYEVELGNTTRAELSYKYPLNQVAQLDDVSKVTYNTSKEFTSHKAVTDKFMNSLKIEGDDLSYYNGEEWINVSGQKIYGLEWDSTTDTYVRLGNSKGKVAQAYSPNNTTPTNDFNSIFPWSQIKRCNLADDGTVNAYYGDVGYIEDGSNGQVMVEIPKFYYKREWDGVKRRWYVSDKEFDGYALLANGTSVHPAFIRNTVTQDNIYVSAYEGCAYDVSATDYITNDAQTVDFTTTTGDLLSSIAGVKPISGLTQDLTIGKSRIIAQNRGTSWQLLDFWSASAIQTLLLIEYGTFNSQAVIGQGVVNKASGTGNESENTGATTTLGNGSGYLGTNGLSSVTYRGIENFWGNIWFWVDGINIKADRQPWVADYNFASDTFSGVYTDTGLTLPSSNNYVRNLHDFDGYLPSEVVSGSGSTFVTDFYFQNTGNRVARLGGDWFKGLWAGAWCWDFGVVSSDRSRALSARLAFLPNT
jgi:hypothetical protein